MKFAVFLQEECNGDGDGKTDYSDEATVEEEVLLLLPWGGYRILFLLSLSIH